MIVFVGQLQQPKQRLVSELVFAAAELPPLPLAVAAAGVADGAAQL